MKQLWPEKPTNLQTIGTDGRKVTYDDILDLIDQISALSTELNLDKEALAQYKQDMQEAITTSTLRSDTIHSLEAFLNSIEAQNVLTDEATITLLHATTAMLTKLTSDEVNTGKLKSNTAEIEEITAREIGATSITTTELNTSVLSVENYNVENVIAETGNIKEVTAESVEADEVNADSITTDALTTESITSTEAEIENIKTDILDSPIWKNSTHTTIEGSDEIYIHIPVLTGRSVYLFKDEDTKLAALQVLNTENNVTVMWSDFAKSPNRWLIDSKFVEMGNYSILILHFKGLTADFEEYVYSDYNDEVLRDQIVYSDDWHVPDTRISDMEYIFGYRNGTKFFRNLDLDKDGGEVHALTGNFTDVYDDTDDDSFTYDTSETIEKLFYRPDQEVNTDSDVEHHNLHLTGALFDGTDVEDEDGNVIGFEGDEASLLFTDGETLEWKKGTDRQILREKETNGVLALEYESPVDNTVYPTALERNDLIPTQETIANYNGTVVGEEAVLTKVLEVHSTGVFNTVEDTYFDKEHGPSQKDPSQNTDIFTLKEGYIAESLPSGNAKPISRIEYTGFDPTTVYYTDGTYSENPKPYLPVGFVIYAVEPVQDYPISELRDGTTTHGNHTVENILEVKNKIKEDVYIGEHAFVGAHSDNTRLNLLDYSLVIEEEEDE